MQLFFVNIFTKLLDFLKVNKEKYKEIFEVNKVKKIEKAIDVAEDTYFLIDNLIHYIEDLVDFNKKELRQKIKKVEINLKQRRELKKIIRLYKKYKRIFFKYNQ